MPISPDAIRVHTLSDGDVTIRLLSVGCVMHSWQVPGPEGPVQAILGYEDPESYIENPFYLGAVIGRVANRIANARFELDGVVYQLPANDGAHHIHGGPRGLSHQNWDSDADGTRGVEFRLSSPDGDQGYPGQVDFAVRISLSGRKIRYEMSAVPDRPTPIALTQHNYYNLMGGGRIFDHRLQVASRAFTPTNSDRIVTGAIQGVAGTSFNAVAETTLRTLDPQAQGIDGNMILDAGLPETVRLTAPNGLQLRICTDQPGLQLYTSDQLRPGAAALSGQDHQPFTGVCLEPQQTPNAVNLDRFPSIICTPEKPYVQRLEFEIV